MGRGRSLADTDSFASLFGTTRGSAAGNALAREERKREKEQQAQAAAAEHARKYAVVVTVRAGNSGKGRRYVVATEADENDLRPLAGCSEEALRASCPTWGSFDAQWLRGFGRVDEMLRVLSFSEVTKVAEIKRSRVWGEGPFAGTGGQFS